ncbi:beta-arabinofuranosyltransferase [Marchantia polymorpha subsp. ruderalis]|uniref:Nucleotide-diphospho-sugar transferase domain-containing protein n=2 Tax=Marchantia polymorpha TaxID=3197 RepID=A0AAF6BRB9_MARPO|nr:hypothetical protein MARPO_0059s0093 [Marchantia polymorpha]BBN14553.1 hypothetical protein Mp_6g12540 [Marchantia polymorpha subsp. ruderalis]|eukprot:PTQ37168.1 hypothetical protein MARPO_0059s0093 [Marchantia polymorpha]
MSQWRMILTSHSELILLPHVSVVLRSLHAVDHDWLLTGLPRTVDDFPYSLRDDWLQAHGVQIEDEKVNAYVKANGNWIIGGVAQFWAWNANSRPLHAGVMPPFVFKQGQHDSWLLAEALTSKYRLVIDGTEALNVFRIVNTMDGNEPKKTREIRGNIELASTYGSYHFRPSKLSDVPFKLVTCGGLQSKTFCIVNLSQQPCVCSALHLPIKARGEQDLRESSRTRWPQTQEHFRSWLDLFLQRDAKLLNNWKSTESSLIVGSDSWTQKVMNFLTQRMLGPSTLPTKQGLDCGCDNQASNRRVLSEKSDFVESESIEEVPYSLENLLKKRASAENVVILAVVGNSYRDMLMNWVCRLKHLNVSNYLVSAIDDDIYRFAVHQGLPVFKSRITMNVSRNECHFGTQCFQKVTKMKSRTVLEILKLGYHVLFSDVDVYWFQDPSQELMAFGPGHMCAQTDQWNASEPLNQPRRLNSGFYFVWSDNRTIAAFSNIVQHAANSEKSEQPSFYDVLCGNGGIYTVGNDLCVQPIFNVTVHFLDPAKYPNGAFQRLWEKKNVREVCEAQGCRVLHNNWVSGRKKKLERQFTTGLWDYDAKTRLCTRSWG